MWPKICAGALIAVLYGVACEQGAPVKPLVGYAPLSGRVVGYNGAPMRNQTVFFSGSGLEKATTQTDQKDIFRIGGTGYVTRYVDVTTQTDQEGRFRFEWVEVDKPASLRMAVTGFDPAPIDIGIARRDLGTIVLQPSGPPVMEHLSSNDATETFLSGRITDSNGVPMAGKILMFSNPKGGSFLKMGENGSFVLPAASYTEYEIYVGHPFAELPPKLRYVGNILVSEGQNVDLGNVALIESSSRKGQVGDIAGPVAGDISGPVKVTGVAHGSESASSSSSESKAALIAVVFAGANGATVIHEDGTIFRAPKEKEQVGCSSPKISPDRKLAGWLVDSDFCCASYSLEFMLVVYAPGTSLRHFVGDGRAIFGWNFLDRGKRVAFFQSFPHGDPVSHYELREIATERLIGKWDGDLTAKAPSWVRGFGR